MKELLKQGNNLSQRVKTRLNNTGRPGQRAGETEPYLVLYEFSRKPCLCCRLERRYQQALPSDSPREAHLNTNGLLEVGGRPRNQTQLAAGVKTPRRNRAGGTHCRSHWTPASHNAISPLTPGLAQPPRPKPDSIPLAGGPLPFWRAPANSQGSFCAAARSYKPGAPGSTLRHDFSATHTHTHAHRRTNAPDPLRPELLLTGW